jgi:hypothetical protein
MTPGQEQAILYLQQRCFNATSEEAKDCWYRALSKLLDIVNAENASVGENVH